MAGGTPNFYVYVNNKPLDFRDPNGTVINLGLAAVGGLLGAGVGAISVVIANPNASLTEVAIAASGKSRLRLSILILYLRPKKHPLRRDVPPRGA